MNNINEQKFIEALTHLSHALEEMSEQMYFDDEWNRTRTYQNAQTHVKDFRKSVAELFLKEETAKDFVEHIK